MLAYTRARKTIQRKDIVITALGNQSLNRLLLSEPETIRVSLEPVLQIMLPVVSKESQNVLRFTLSFHCKKMKFHTPFRECNEGVRLDFEMISKDEWKLPTFIMIMKTCLVALCMNLAWPWIRNSSQAERQVPPLPVMTYPAENANTDHR